MASEEKVEVSVIIPAKNGSARLEALLRSLRERGPGDIPFEIIVVDDASDEDLGAMCRAYGAAHHRLEPGQGPATARNKGAELASGPILFFFDADVVYPGGLIERAKAELDADPEVQAVSFQNQPYDPKDGVVQNFGAAIEYYWFADCIPLGERRAEAPGISTRNTAVRKGAFDAVGGFNPRFATNAMEDYDISKRLSARFKLILADGPPVYHHYPATLRRLLRNYFVRTALFVPYQLEHKRSLDERQISRSEGLLRLLGSGSFVCLLLGFLPIPLRMAWLGLAGAGFVGYLMGVSAFLRFARTLSNDFKFPCSCLFIHYASSLAITLGGLWGLLHYVCAAMTMAAGGKPKGRQSPS